MASNLPPGCSSPDGGINHKYETAIEKALNMAEDAGLDAQELLYAMQVGIDAVELMRPIVSEAAKEEIDSDRIVQEETYYAEDQRD